MTDAKKIMVRVISVTATAIILTIFFASLVLASRDKNIFPSNYSLGGIVVGNLSNSQAHDLLESSVPSKWGKPELQLKLPDKVIALKADECGFDWDFNAALNKAEAGLNGERGIAGIFQHSIIRGRDQDLKLVYQYDKHLLYKNMLQIRENYNKPAIDARILYNNGELDYITHKNGYTINIAATMKNIDDALQNGNLGPVEAAITLNSPRVKIDDIKTVKDILGVYAQPLKTSGSNNLNAAINEFNGIIIMPGEVFSSYKHLEKIISQVGVAPLDLNGLSSLMNAFYHASLQARVKIIERPCQGNGFNNLIIQNNLQHPILVSAVIQEEKLSVTIFGCQTEAGKEICLITEEREIPPPVKLQTDIGLRPGQRVVQQEGKNGRIISTYRVVNHNGHRVEKTLLTEEIHSGTDTIVLQGPGNIDK